RSPHRSVTRVALTGAGLHARGPCAGRTRRRRRRCRRRLMIWRWTPLLAVAMLAACARGSRPSLLPVGVHDPRADTPARADIQSPRSHRYRVALAFDATPTYEATGYDT